MRSIPIALLLLSLLEARALSAPDCSYFTTDPYYGSHNFNVFHPASSAFGSEGTQFADMDGDGRADAVTVSTHTNGAGTLVDWIGVRYARWHTDTYSYRFVDQTIPLEVISAWEDTGLQRVFFADVDADGDADGISIVGNIPYVRINDGRSFAPLVAWSTSAFIGAIETYVADVDGDHRADLIAFNSDAPNGILVRLSTGTSFAPSTIWTRGRRGDPSFGGNTIAFADVTNDGRADAIAVRDDGVYVRPSTGVGFDPEQLWTSSIWWGPMGTSFSFADATGDGAADLISILTEGSSQDGVYVTPSQGNAFSGTIRWLYYPPLVGDIRTAFAPVNDLHRVDLLMVSGWSPIRGRINLGWGFQVGGCKPCIGPQCQV